MRPLRRCHHIATDAARKAPDAVAGDQQRAHVARDAASPRPARRRRTAAATHSARTRRRPPPRCASRSASGPARRKKNQAAPTISQTRPSSDVSWRRLDSAEAEARAPPPAVASNERAGAASRPRRRADAARRLAGDRQHPAERARQRLAQEQQHREHQHAQPQVALVVEREVAVDRVAVRRQVQQQQPAEAGREHEAGVADARAHGLRRRGCARPLRAAAHHGPCQQQQGRGAEPPARSRPARCRAPRPAAPARTRALSASGHGTRASQAASAHSASAAAMPNAGDHGRRLHSTQTKPSSIAPAHCQPAVASSARIASFLRAFDRDCRASPINAAVADSASVPPASHGGARARHDRQRAPGASAGGGGRPSSAAAISSSALAPRGRRTRPARARAPLGRADSSQRGAGKRHRTADACRFDEPVALGERLAFGFDRGHLVGHLAHVDTAVALARSQRGEPVFGGAHRRGERPRRCAVACASSSGRRVGSGCGVPPTVRPHRRSRTDMSARAASAAHAPGSTSSGRPWIANAVSAKRRSRPPAPSATRSNAGHSNAIAAITASSSSSAGTCAPRAARGACRSGVEPIAAVTMWDPEPRRRPRARSADQSGASEREARAYVTGGTRTRSPTRTGGGAS